MVDTVHQSDLSARPVEKINECFGLERFIIRADQNQRRVRSDTRQAC